MNGDGGGGGRLGRGGDWVAAGGGGEGGRGGVQELCATVHRRRMSGVWSHRCTRCSTQPASYIYSDLLVEIERWSLSFSGDKRARPSGVLTCPYMPLHVLTG